MIYSKSQKINHFRINKKLHFTKCIIEMVKMNQTQHPRKLSSRAYVRK